MENYTFPPQPNRSDWSWTYEAFADDGTPIDLDAITGRSIKLQVHAPSAITPCEPLIQGTDTDGTIVVAGSTFSVMVRAGVLDDLRAGSYHVSLVMTDGTNTAQLLLGTLPLIEGYST